MTWVLAVPLFSAFSLFWIGIIVFIFFKRQAADFRSAMAFLRTTSKNIEQTARMTYLAQKEAATLTLSSQLVFFLNDLERRLLRSFEMAGLMQSPFSLTDLERAFKDSEFVSDFYDLITQEPDSIEPFKDFVSQYEKVRQLIETYDTNRLYVSYFTHTPLASMYKVLTEAMEGLYIPEVKEFFKEFKPSKPYKRQAQVREEEEAHSREPAFNPEDVDDPDEGEERDVPPIDWAKAKNEPLKKYKR